MSNAAKKIINNPNACADELFDGLVLAYDGKARRVGKRSIVMNNLRPNAPALLVGGGAGHEPIYHGLIGKGMADGASRTVEQRRAGMARYAELARALASLDKPLIAAVDGVAFGAGLSMALYADIVLVSTRARLAMVFHRIGLVPDVGAWYQLPRVVGLQRAKELIYSAREFGADEAVRMNIALEALAPEALMPRAMELARSLAGASPTAFSLSKRALAATLQSDLETMLDMEASSQAIALSSAYFREAIRRFAAKEPAQFCWPNKD